LSTGSSQIHGGSFNFCGGNGSSFIGQIGSTTGDMNICYGDDCSVRNSASNNFVFGRSSSVRSTGSYCVAMGNNVNSLFGSNNFLFGVSCGTTSFGNAFIYNSNSGSQLNSSANNQISFNAFGGYRFFTDASNTIGVSLAPSANAWAIISDKRMKSDIVEANYDDVLDKVSRVPVFHYRFKSRESLKKAHEECGYEACCPVEGECPYSNTLEVNPLCFGCMSQDWNAIFSGNEQDPLSINTNEVMFSSIAAIKALKNQVDQLKSEMNLLRKELGLSYNL
jgi:Chaperone of endosialidase